MGPAQASRLVRVPQGDTMRTRYEIPGFRGKVEGGVVEESGVLPYQVNPAATPFNSSIP